MKLLGYIEVYDYVNSRAVSRSKHSTITIGNDKGTTVLLLQQPSNKRGSKYKVSHNIAIVYARFIEEGKITIRFKEPSHELRLVNEAILLKSFLTLLQNCYRSVEPSLPPLLAIPKFVKAPPTTAVIDKPTDVKVLDRLSLRLTKLQISKVHWRGLPPSVARLKNLSILEVDTTCIMKFPTCLGGFPALTYLSITNSLLDFGRYWDFLECRNIQERLQFLDLSHNRLSTIPPRICALKELVTLKVDYNLLIWVPHTLSRMKKLRHFSSSHNLILSFPSTMFHLKDVHVDVSYNAHRFPQETRYGNPYKIQLGNLEEIRDAYFTRMSTLKELCSRVIVNKRLPYRKFSLPSCLVYHLNEAKVCQQCSKSCFTHYFIVFGCALTKNFSHEVVFTGTNVTTHFFVCSRECMLLSYPKLNSQSRGSICYVSYTL